DLPEPETPVKTTSLCLGISRYATSRLCSRAPFTTITSDSSPSALRFGMGREAYSDAEHLPPCFPRHTANPDSTLSGERDGVAAVTLPTLQPVVRFETTKGCCMSGAMHRFLLPLLLVCGCAPTTAYVDDKP